MRFRLLFPAKPAVKEVEKKKKNCKANNINKIKTYMHLNEVK